MDSSDSDQENNNTAIRQNTQQRKLCYRDLLNKVEGIQESEDLGLQTVKGIGEVLKQVNAIESEHNISQRYQNPDETLLDAMVLSSASSILVKCVEALDVNSATYDPSEFAKKIIDNISEGDELEDNDLLKLLVDVNNIIPKVPAYTFTYGTYDLNTLPQPKPKKERQKQQREQYEKKEPEKITSLNKEEQGIDETVKVLYDVLLECFEQNQQQPIKYYDYVIDTSSFSNTVENMFYCSFLIRDGKAHLDLDGKGVPYIKPVKKSQLKQFRNDGGSNSQVITAITIPEWETFKREGYLQKYKNMTRTQT